MKMTFIAAMILGIAIGAPASARNYDCSKAGNANKAACKGGATVTTKTTVKTASKAMPASKASATKVTTSTATKTTATRNYDCTKAGNANKSACKTATAPVSRKATTTTVATYDCTKFLNRMRAVCRNQSASTRTSASTNATVPGSMTRPTVTQSRTTTSMSRTVNSDAAGASAQCKDGSFSHSKVHTGACSRHGGVAKWL